MSTKTSGVTVVIEYFAVFKEERGLATESVETGAGSLRELYKELADTHGLHYDPESVRVAKNDEFASWDDTPSEGDRIVFLAPFGGG